MKNYFRMMAACFGASLTVLALSAKFHLDPLLSMVAATAPLAYYHLGFLTPQARRGLSQSAIDSVYYFGFLVTVAALGISALSIASGGAGDNINLIVYQFGVGLIATGYAVIARLHLSSATALVDEASPEALLDRYVKRSVELVTNVEMASEQLTAFSTSIMQKTAETSEAARVSVQQAMLESARMFQDEMKATLATARESLTTIRGLVAETSFAAERKELVASMNATISATTSLSQSLEELTVKTRAGAEAAHATAARSADVEEALASFAAQISRFGGEGGVVAKASESLRESSLTMEMCNTSMAGAAVGLSEMIGTVADTGATFKNMRALTKKAGEQLDSLAETCEKLDVSAERMTNAAMASDSLAVGMSKVAAAFEPLTTTSSAFNDSLSSAVSASANLHQQLADLPSHGQKLKAISDQVADSLDQIAEIIEDAVEQASTLAIKTTQSATSVEAAERLLANGEAVGTTLADLQKMMSELASSVSSWKDAIDASSHGISSSLAKSSAALENDVKRSSAAASLLTEKLVTVAETIIQRTRVPEAA